MASDSPALGQSMANPLAASAYSTRMRPACGAASPRTSSTTGSKHSAPGFYCGHRSSLTILQEWLLSLACACVTTLDFDLQRMQMHHQLSVKPTYVAKPRVYCCRCTVSSYDASQGSGRMPSGSRWIACKRNSQT